MLTRLSTDVFCHMLLYLSVADLLRLHATGKPFATSDDLHRQMIDQLQVCQISFTLTQDRLYLTKAGTVVASGDNKHYKLGVNMPTLSYPRVVVKALGNNIKKLSLGMAHSAFLDKDGFVWVTGQNDQGQLGLGKDILLAKEPRKILGLPTVIDLFCGIDFTILLDQQENMYFAGRNNSSEIYYSFKCLDMSDEQLPFLRYALSASEQEISEEEKTCLVPKKGYQVRPSIFRSPTCVNLNALDSNEAELKQEQTRLLMPPK